MIVERRAIVYSLVGKDHQICANDILMSITLIKTKDKSYHLKKHYEIFFDTEFMWRNLHLTFHFHYFITLVYSIVLLGQLRME
jgi:hypothetical protein